MDVYWIWLSTLPYVGPVLQKRLLEAYGTPKSVYDAQIIESNKIKGMTKRALNSIKENRSLHLSEAILTKTTQKGIHLLTYENSSYPDHVKQCKTSPILYYYKGTLKSFDEAVAVVGSRRCTVYGKQVANELSSYLASMNIPVISGFAKGIDSYAHTACIQNGGYTISILAGGVDHCYPQEHLLLYEKILQSGGLFLSVYPPGTKPSPKYFIQRNSLISAWATKVVIVEASEKSGAIWTADFGKKQGKQVFAVPNRITT